MRDVFWNDRRLVAALHPGESEPHAAAERTPTPEGGRASDLEKGENETLPFQPRCVWADGRRMLINTCYLTIQRHNLGLRKKGVQRHSKLDNS